MKQDSSTAQAPPAAADAEGEVARFRRLRGNTETLCQPLEPEDYVVQPAPYVSPPKWHLAHTSWFFDRFLLEDAAAGARAAEFNRLFNSYYKSQGQHWLQDERGHLSRPTLREILAWRRRVDEAVARKLESGGLSPRQHRILAIGLQHEMQHQELLLMDIKRIFAGHPCPPAYDEVSRPGAELRETPALGWLRFDEGLGEFGGGGDEGFAWDNESPRHRRWLDAFALADRLITNAEYLDFINDGGYQRPQLWLSDGWDWRREHGVEHPLYWRREEGAWLEYHLGGLAELAPALPVSHLSYYEADAFARWAGARLPTEFELERYFHEHAVPALAPPAFWRPGAAVCPLPGRAGTSRGDGLLWQWTSSPYAAYPGFIPEQGALGEYNGKFMCNQLVLRGGCAATPAGHWRPGYRNFYRPSDRWAFCGLRLARDA